MAGTSVTRGKAGNPRRALLWAGIVGPILFASVFMIDGLLKPGYSASDEAISYLEVGAGGWIQRANFVLFGLLLFVFLDGYIRSMRPILDRLWLSVVSVLLALSDLGWIMAGLFVPDPYRLPQNSWHAVLHQVASTTIFLPLAVACLILGASLVRIRGWRAYGLYSLVFGLLQMVFPIGTIVYLLGPNVVGNVNTPGDGVTNRLVLALGPFAWYVVSATIGLLRRDG